MLQKKTMAPTTRRRFASGWNELDYLCNKMSYWLYTRKQKSGAERYLKRLELVLRALPENNVAIIRAEALSLQNELKGNIDGAIAYRKREIELIEKLHQDAHASKYSDKTRAYMIQGRDVSDLEKRREILDSLQKAKALPS